MIYDAVFPFGYRRHDLHNAMACLVNAPGNKKRRNKLADFLLVKDKVEPQTGEEMKALMTMFAAQQNALAKKNG